MTVMDRGRVTRGRSPRTGRHRRLAAIVFGLAAVIGVPALVAAHPLGNFTINHYAGIRVEADRIWLDVVIDQAEIPTFQARLAFDTDGDGELSIAEAETGRVEACRALAGALDLRLDGERLDLSLTEAGLTFPPGAGGLSTMRSVCVFEAGLAEPLGDGATLAFVDQSFSERVGWREIVVAGSGVTLEAGEGTLRTSSPSARLTRYPKDLLTQALADTELMVEVSPGGPTLAPYDVRDADPVAPSQGTTGDAAPAPENGSAPGPANEPTGPVDAAVAAVPGGVGADDLPSIFRAADLTPLVLFVSMLTAAALGAGHALTPGHGKTLMAAYLVGTRGTPIHAAGLGLSVAMSHTLGILALAALVVGAQGVLPPDVVVRTAPVLAAISIVAIGGWMLFGEARRRWAGRERDDQGSRHEHPHEAEHAHDHGHDSADGNEHGHAHERDEPAHAGHDQNAHRPAEHGHAVHSHDAHSHAHDAEVDAAATGEHSHGGLTHSHLPRSGSTISWRSLFVLGLAGGLIPSASALLILLGSIAAGRPAFGFVLVVAFGLGMAAVMSGIGLALVLARGRLDRVDTGSWLGRASAQLPLLASCLVLGFGIYLTVQAVSGATVL